MSGCLRLLIAVIGGAVVAQYSYMIVGMAIFGALMPFGLDDDLWNAEALSNIVFIIVALGCWAGSSWFIWWALKPRRKERNGSRG